MLRTVLLALVMCCSTYAAAKSTNERVIATIPGGGVQLESTGKAAFASLLFPDAARAEAWLAAHVLQQPIAVSVAGEDRYGRALITSTIEEKMLREGVAIFYASDGEIPTSWKSAERAAREHRNGVWAIDGRAITSENAAQHFGSFAVVAGSVTRIYESKKATYINFGNDWHSDFSITIPAKNRRSMKALLAALKAGSKVEVRGVIYEENGPMITLTHNDNLELR